MEHFNSIPFENLTQEEKTSVQTLISFSGQSLWDIEFWIENEAVLRVISWAKKGIKNCFVTVIAPCDQFWKPYLI